MRLSCLEHRRHRRAGGRGSRPSSGWQGVKFRDVPDASILAKPRYSEATHYLEDQPCRVPHLTSANVSPQPPQNSSRALGSTARPSPRSPSARAFRRAASTTTCPRRPLSQTLPWRIGQTVAPRLSPRGRASGDPRASLTAYLDAAVAEAPQSAARGNHRHPRRSAPHHGSRGRGRGRAGDPRHRVVGRRQF